MIRRHQVRRSAFSLIEALVAITIMAVAGGAIMMGLTSSVQTTTTSLESTIATGIARQIIDEVLGQRYAAVGAGPYQTDLIPSSWELEGNGRERFDDTDDFHGFTAQPVEGVWGRELGQGDDAGELRHEAFRLPAGYFADWSEEIEVYYVSESNPSVRLTGTQTSNFRAVEVRILRATGDGTQTELTTLRRVYAYVPTPQ